MQVCTKASLVRPHITPVMSSIHPMSPTARMECQPLTQMLIHVRIKGVLEQHQKPSCLNLGTVGSLKGKEVLTTEGWDSNVTARMISSARAGC